MPGYQVQCSQHLGTRNRLQLERVVFFSHLLKLFTIDYYADIFQTITLTKLIWNWICATSHGSICDLILLNYHSPIHEHQWHCCSAHSAAELLAEENHADMACVCSDCPVKVFVNEDRMAARLHDLHLDNNNLDWHPDLEREPWYSRRLRSVHVLCSVIDHTL